MEYRAPSDLIRELDRQLKRILAAIDIRSAEPAERAVLEAIRGLTAFAMKYINEYELGDSREEQQASAGNAHESLEKLRAAILKASEHGHIGAIDVADTTGQIDHIESVLRR